MAQHDLQTEPEVNINELLDRVTAIIGRRRWAILITLPVVVFGTLAVLSRIPNKYSSEATLLVVQQQVPQRYVLPTTTTDLREGLQATTQEVLSRSRLLQIIDEFGLYPKEKGGVAPEGLLDLMRHDIKIEPLEGQSGPRDVNSFKISFVASNPELAQRVTSRLTSLFIEQNLATREHQATITTKFLHDQLESVKAKLTEAEDQVRGFKTQNLGALPEQQQGNLAILSGVQNQLASTELSLNRAQERREYVQSLVEARSRIIEADLTRLKSERSTLMAKYTANYPVVVQNGEKIAQAEALLRTLRGAATQGAVDAAAQAGGEEAVSVAQLRSQLQSNRKEIENLKETEARLKSESEKYQSRLYQTPLREQQLAGILRNYDQLKQDYADLLNKEMQSQLAADLEKRQEGQQFRIVDQPSLPTIPFSPKRVKISLGAAGAGLALGAALALLMELRDRSFRSETEFRSAISAPFVLGLPALSTAGEQQASAKRRTYEWMGAAALFIAIFAAEFYEFYLYRHG